MSLPLKPGTGYLYSKPRPTPAKHKELISEHITELLEQGIISSILAQLTRLSLFFIQLHRQEVDEI